MKTKTLTFKVVVKVPEDAELEAGFETALAASVEEEVWIYGSTKRSANIGEDDIQATLTKESEVVG